MGASFVPRDFQIDGCKLIDGFEGRALVGDEMGLGKTAQTLLWLKNHKEIKFTVVICPASLKWHWQREAWNHFGLRSTVLDGRTPPNPLPKMNPIVIINYDILKEWVPVLLEHGPDLIIIDECQMLGDIRTIRYKKTKDLCRPVPYILGLSGTAFTNKLIELWPICNLIRPKEYPSYFDFGFRYCQPKRTHWGWQFPGACRMQELNAKLTADLLIRRRKADVLKDLPVKTRQVIAVDIVNRRDYQLAEEDFLAWVMRNDPSKMSSVSRAEGLVKIGYLKRLAAKLKLPAICEWIDNFLDSGQKLIMFGTHKAILGELMTRYDKQAVLVNGDVAVSKRRDIFDRFNQDPNCRLFLGNIRACGSGWSCTSASTVAFCELDWTPGQHRQAEDRVHGIGRGERGRGAFAFYLVARNTIEERLCEIIQVKQGNLDAVLDNNEVEDNLNVFDDLLRILRKTEAHKPPPKARKAHR